MAENSEKHQTFAQWRAGAGLTQQQLADLLGHSSTRMIVYYEAGQTVPQWTRLALAAIEAGLEPVNLASSDSRPASRSPSAPEHGDGPRKPDDG